MIVCHRHKLIFIKSLKTAGTSIEVALAKHCGPHDIITEIFPAIPGHKAQNFRALFVPVFGVCSPADLKKNLSEFVQRKKFYNHIPARFARARMPQSVWDSYLKICVERNPWDKTISHFQMFRNAEWHRRYNANLTLDSYLDNGFFCHNAPFYCDTKGNVLVDQVIRYDRLEEELAAVFKNRGIPFEGLPKAKSSLRLDKRPYREILKPVQAEKIKQAFSKEIEIHGWEY